MSEYEISRDLTYDAIELVRNGDILTDWKEFAEIDLPELNRAVRFPIVIDGRNLYKPQQMADHGFTYVSIGRPANYNAQQGKPKKIVFA